MRLILTRHYKTQSNAAGKILGWADSPPRDGWERDIEFVVDRLRARDVDLDAVYSSDLSRSRETAKAYARKFGVTEVIGEPELREINYGELQTRTKKWAYQNYPEHKLDPDLVYPAGESFRQMQQRSVNCISRLASLHAGETILVVSHAGSIRGIVSHFLGLDYAASLKFRVPFRYSGDFTFDAGSCVRYDELGQLSGFVGQGVIQLPFNRSDATD